LAGSFNNWSPEALRMDRTDSGWIAAVKLAPGKHWYKFVVDGGWQVDGDNLLKENDGRGNINSVYYRTNHVFELEGHTNAKKVFLAGSFNQWNAKSLPMLPTGNGWQIPVYLAEGTHTYKFVVDNRWIADPRNNERMDDGAGGFNSVIRLGQPHHFRLDGFANAKKVMLSGTFNNWNPSELPMNKTATGWELPYVVGAGNHEYKFIVDGQWIADPANPATEGKNGNSFLVAQPNYVFRLKGFDNAKSVFLSGTFNDWKPAQLAMKREGDSWVFPIYLEPGKHLYKFVVDGKWILDPQNRLWEQNKEGSGNSVMWIEPGR
ncbi:MAG TPA: hypothetical protein VEC37_11550, partial [Bacillota bacterium]|nr:hypothetical protein [Bacillota bacterium]